MPHTKTRKTKLNEGIEINIYTWIKGGQHRTLMTGQQFKTSFRVKLQHVRMKIGAIIFENVQIRNEKNKREWNVDKTFSR